MILTGLTGTVYTLNPKPIGSGGEGEVYRIKNMNGKVAKVYTSGALTQELTEKLIVMIKRPPNENVQIM